MFLLMKTLLVDGDCRAAEEYIQQLWIFLNIYFKAKLIQLT